jgi:FAD:protein FMN transferase
MFDSSYRYVDFNTYKAHSFFCMGGLCEILIETPDKILSNQIFSKIYEEAKRIEKKFSRYDNTNIIYKINNAHGKKVHLDKETAKLIHYADQIYKVSDGMFDITSGILRKAWTFDQSSNVPHKEEVENLLPFIGWQKVKLEKRALTLPKDFQLDLGGIGKEYAVDSCVQIAKAFGSTSTLVNFGGDIGVTGPKKNHQAWVINIDGSTEKYNLLNSGIATSGDKNKFLISNGKKLSHILNPKTGWALQDAPSSITVVADNCTAAGTLSTLAMLKAPNHLEFLTDEAEYFFIN